MLEIERKYLVKNSSYKDLASQKREIAQGYLTRKPERTVRVRISGEKGYLTVKGITTSFTRHEYEYEIPLSDACEMLAMCEKGIVEKCRYIVDFKGHRWEVDEYQGALKGLVVAEIELAREDVEFSLPSFVGKEVTGNPEYYNSTLSEMAATGAFPKP